MNGYEWARIVHEGTKPLRSNKMSSVSDLGVRIAELIQTIRVADRDIRDYARNNDNVGYLNAYARRSDAARELRNLGIPFEVE